jgi:hypothetical protein
VAEAPSVRNDELAAVCVPAYGIFSHHVNTVRVSRQYRRQGVPEGKARCDQPGRAGATGNTRRSTTQAPLEKTTHFSLQIHSLQHSTYHAWSRTVGLDEGGGQLGDLLHVSVALDAVLRHAAIHGDNLVLIYNYPMSCKQRRDPSEMHIIERTPKPFTTGSMRTALAHSYHGTHHLNQHQAVHTLYRP